VAEVLRTSGLTRHFGALAAVDDVSMEVCKGEILSIIGPNGAGKTTLFNLITGFVAPTRGEVWVKGERVTGKRPDEIAERGVIRTFQETETFAGVPVLDGIVMGFHRVSKPRIGAILLGLESNRREEDAIRARAVQLLRSVGIEDKRDMVARDLTYGQQKLVAIAVAMAAGPELLLLDEPTAGLNARESWDMVEVIQGIQESGVTVGLVEHDMNVVMGISDRIIVLDAGCVIAIGEPDQIQKNEQVIEAYLGKEYASA